MTLNRREFMGGLAGAVMLYVLDPRAAHAAAVDGLSATGARLQDGRMLDQLRFVKEGNAPVNQAMGECLEGRLYTDLSTLQPDALVTPTEAYYLRTRTPDKLDLSQPWTIRMDGLVASEVTVTMDDLKQMRVPCGTHVMECSGNGAFGHFGMLSCASWAGAPIGEVFKKVSPLPAATHVLVSGFDEYSTVAEGTISIPGCSWIFPIDTLVKSGAFLATHMNDARLTPDHGAPVRLYVPNHYGCTCVKWVNEIRFVGPDEAATAHMKEFAQRTHQIGVPPLARDFKPANIEQAAMVVRVERWVSGKETIFRVVGVTWGGPKRTQKLLIRFHPQEKYVPVHDVAPQTEGQPWELWSHLWKASPGYYAIQLQVDDPEVRAPRLVSGFYTRSVEVPAS